MSYTTKGKMMMSGMIQVNVSLQITDNPLIIKFR